jgi:hypothetical protein
MRPTQHPSNNSLLRAAPGARVEQCRPVAITKVMYQNGLPGVESYWQPSAAEREAIAAGALVRFSVWGETHPPVYLGVDGIEE